MPQEEKIKLKASNQGLCFMVPNCFTLNFCTEFHYWQLYGSGCSVLLNINEYTIQILSTIYLNDPNTNLPPPPPPNFLKIIFKQIIHLTLITLQDLGRKSIFPWYIVQHVDKLGGVIHGLLHALPLGTVKPLSVLCYFGWWTQCFA